MKKKDFIYSYIAVIVLSLVFMGLSLRMEYFSAKMLPLIISSVVIILAAIGLSRWILARGKSGTTTAPDETDSGEGAGESWYQYALVGAWVVGFFLAIYLLGFIIAIPLFLLSYLKAHGTKWRTAITFAILTTGIVYGVFVVALKVYLYEGLLFS